MGQSEQSDVVALRGYLGKGTSDDYRNLYETLDLQKHLAIRVKDIVGEDTSKAGTESVIMVRREAGLLLCEPVPASMYDGAPGAPLWPRP